MSFNIERLSYKLKCEFQRNKVGRYLIGNDIDCIKLAGFLELFLFIWHSWQVFIKLVIYLLTWADTF